MVDPATGRPLFATRCIELACAKCKEDGKSHECVHMLHLVPSWQSAERHRKLKIMVGTPVPVLRAPGLSRLKPLLLKWSLSIYLNALAQLTQCVLFFLQMQDRPDLIQSELAGLAFDSLQQVFRKCDIEILFNSSPLPCVLGQTIWIVVDPAAGGPQSDYAVVSICRVKGCVVVSALRQHVGLLARVDKVLQRVRVVCEKVEHQHAPQVGDEAAELRRVGGDVEVK